MQLLVPWQSNKYYTAWLCFCSCRYPTCNEHAPFCYHAAFNAMWQSSWMITLGGCNPCGSNDELSSVALYAVPGFSSNIQVIDVEYIYGFVWWGVCKQSRWRHSVTVPEPEPSEDGGYVLLWQRYDNNKMVAMRYYGNVILHLQQYSHRLNLFLF